MKKTISDYSQIEPLADLVAKQIKGGEVFALSGPLGSGKTFFCQLLGKKLKTRSRITSPTFSIMHCYSAKTETGKKIRFYHMDAYRLRSAKDAVDLNLPQIFKDKNNIALVEWAEKIKSLLPKKTLYIKFKTLSVFAGILMAFAAHGAHAQDFKVVLESREFVVPQETLKSFQGASALPSEDLLLYHPPSPEELLYFAKGEPLAYNKKTKTSKFNINAIYQFVLGLKPQIDTPVIEPVLEIQNFRATKFTPPQNGLNLNAYSSSFNILSALEASKTTADLAAEVSQPQNSLAQTNDLGIVELIGKGESSFAGSPKNRRHNIKIGMEKMTGIIIKPGEIFSFNQYLGEVDEKNGFLPELVIKKTGTVPELGGGLCQVSSTTFRAAMQSGLPIKERRNHAYAVQYYAPQGTDATIYPGVVDFKFLNDTGKHILIWPYLKDANNLVFDFYGTKDDRQITLEKPIQYDRKLDGSMKAEWTRVVIKDGTTSTSTFKSIYQSPALFHKTEEFPTTTPITSNPITPIN